MPREVGKALGRGKKSGPRSGAILFQKKKNGLSHRDIMNKRHQKKKKKNRKNNEERKKELLDEYNKLNDVNFKSKKTTAREIMEIVEDIKEEGLNDKNYLAIMDELMALNNEEPETPVQVRQPMSSRELYERFLGWTDQREDRLYWPY